MTEENQGVSLNQKPQNPNSVKSPKKFILIITTIVLIVISVVFCFIVIKVLLNPNSNQDIDPNFQSKYGINDQIKVNNRFIYFRYSEEPPEYLMQLVVSDASGDNLVVLKDIIQMIDSPDEPRPYLIFPSPKGSYYISLSIQDGRIGAVLDINGKEIFKLPEPIEFTDVLKWSPDERYLARIDSTDWIVVYDVLRGVKIFEKELNVKEELNAVTHDLDKTRPKVVWAENDDILYSFDETGIKIISNFDTIPTLKNIATPYPCYGLAIRGNEFFCAAKMGNIWSGSEKTPYSGGVIKYTLLGDQLSKPLQVTMVPLRGEYYTDLYFLDNKYLLFTPSLGLNTVIDVDSGKIGELSDFTARTSIDHSKEIELFNERGNYPEDYQAIIYKGNTSQTPSEELITFQGQFDNHMTGFENPGLFSFEHPKDWSADFNRSDNERFNRYGAYIMHFGSNTPSENSSGFLSIENLNAKAGQDFNLNQTIDDYIKKENNGANDISIADFNGRIITSQTNNINFYRAYLKDGNRVIKFNMSDTNGGSLEIFKQIIASFKFYFNGSAPDFKY